MFDIGSIELLLVAIVALVVVGPKELPTLLRSVAGFVRKIRALGQEFRRGLDTLSEEVEQEIDPFADLKREEGLKPGMSPEEITDKILSNRGGGQSAGHSDQVAEQTADQENTPSNAEDDDVSKAKKSE